jgi:circadian clock protein KaiB
MSADKDDTREAFERALADSENSQYVLRLFVAGTSPTSNRAIANLKALCRDQLAERYELEVIDLLQRPVLAREEQIIATPTLIKKLPPPLRRIIGDLSNTEDVLVGLDLRPKDDD